MRKISSLLKGTAATVLLLTATSVQAAPALESILGEYNFTATVNYASDVMDDVKALVPETFTFSLNQLGSNVSIGGFLGWKPIQANYSGGDLTPRNFGYFSASADEFELFLSSPDGSVGYGECYEFSWTVNDDGSITIPDFIVRKAGFTAYPYPVENVATFTNIKVIKSTAGGGEEPEPGPGEDDGSHPESILGKYKFTGEVAYSASLNDAAKAMLPTSFEFVIDENTENSYNIRPQVHDFLFFEDPVILNYNAQTGIIKNNPYQYFSYFGVPGVEYMVVMGNANGSEYGSDYDFEWTAGSNGTITFPTFTICDFVGNVLATYSNAKATLILDMPTTVEGKYSFSGTVVYGNNTAEETQAVLPASFDFEITMSDEFNPKPQITNFLFFEDPVKVTYNSEEGTIKNNPYQYFSYFGVPGVEYMVVMGDANGSEYGSDYNFEWSVQPNGNLSLPTFTICDFVGNVLATYSDGKAVLTSGPGAGGSDGDNHNFAGTHEISGLYKYDYLANANDPTLSENNTIEFSVNDNKKLTSFAGYTLSEDYGLLEVKGNVATIEINGFSNVLSSEEPEEGAQNKPVVQVLLGNNVTSEYVQNGAPVLISYNEDGTYSISDFTIWEKTVEFPTGAGAEIKTTMKLLYSYVNELPESSDPTYSGKISGSYSQDTNTFDYEFNYSITYNENKTLTISANFEWPNGEPVGYVNGLSVVIPGVGASPNANQTSPFEYLADGNTKTFEAGDEIEFTFGTAVAMGTVEVKVPYVVGSTVADDYAKIEGNWIFNLYDHYAGDFSTGSFTAQYKAVVNGDVVTFIDEEGNNNIVAQFTSPTTLLFKQVAVGVPAKYTLTMMPFINNSGTNDIEELTATQFTALFNPEAGSIEFPDNSGVMYGNWDSSNEVFNSRLSAFDFKSAVSNSDPSITLQDNISYSANVDNNEFYLNFSYSAYNIPAGSTITAYLKEANPENDQQMTVSGSPVSWTIYDLPAGVYYFTLYLQATDAEGNVIATSNEVALSSPVTVGIETIEAEGAAARFFNLQGVEVANPENGGVYIRIQNGKAVKVVK